MVIPKFGVSKKKRLMHYVSSALIEKNGKILLINRRLPPFGFAGIGGHVDFGEDALHALRREVREETGLTVTGQKLLFEKEVAGNRCVMGINTHYWYLFECDVSGRVRKDSIEEKSIGWYSIDEMKKLKLEPIWKYWFKRLKII